MIKLIVSDIDGTLIRHGQLELPAGLFDEIRRLKKLGITFCPASGRQLSSMQKLFAPVSDELYYICENGSIVYGPQIYKSAMDRSDVIALANEILSMPLCEVFLSGSNMTYLIPKHVRMAAYTELYIRNNYKVLEKPENIPEDIIKVSAFCISGEESEFFYPYSGRSVLADSGFRKQALSDTDTSVPGWHMIKKGDTHEAYASLLSEWGSRYNVVDAGNSWVDVTASSKGLGLERLSTALGISRDEIMAFGDAENDLSMLEFAGHPYVMESGIELLKNRFPMHCGNVIEVLSEIRG